MHSTGEGATDLHDACLIGDCRRVMQRLIETGLRVQMLRDLAALLGTTLRLR